MDCTHCNRPLTESQYRDNKKKKSCPRCSTSNGDEHVYYDYPSEFGRTPLRATANTPDGAQSYCVACRGGQKPIANHILCSNL